MQQSGDGSEYNIWAESASNQNNETLCVAGPSSRCIWWRIWLASEELHRVVVYRSPIVLSRRWLLTRSSGLIIALLQLALLRVPPPCLLTSPSMNSRTQWRTGKFATTQSSSSPRACCMSVGKESCDSCYGGLYHK